jgi:hypothetical protein
MDFSSMEKEINDAPEPRVLNKGEEVQVRIIAVNTGISEKNGAPWFMPRYDVPKDPMVKEFTDFMWDPSGNSKLDEKSKQRNTYHIQQFFKCFKIDISKPFQWEDLVGKLGWVIAGQRTTDDYGVQNSVSKYITGQGQDKTATPVDPNY